MFAPKAHIANDPRKAVVAVRAVRNLSASRDDVRDRVTRTLSHAGLQGHPLRCDLSTRDSRKASSKCVSGIITVKASIVHYGSAVMHQSGIGAGRLNNWLAASAVRRSVRDLQGFT